MLVVESQTPPPRFDALLETGPGGALSVRAPQPPGDTVAALDDGAPYRLLGRSGGLHVFLREGAGGR